MKVKPAEWWLASERHDGWFDLYAYPPQSSTRATTAAGLMRMVRDGQSVVAKLRSPAGVVCDLALSRGRVRWHTRPRPVPCRCGVCRECMG